MDKDECLPPIHFSFIPVRHVCCLFVAYDSDAEKILSELKKNSGVLPYGDKSSPNLIKKNFGMSKAAFKRALLRLLKEAKDSQSATMIKWKE